jgi:hypothetical protein
VIICFFFHITLRDFRINQPANSKSIVLGAWYNFFFAFFLRNLVASPKKIDLDKKKENGFEVISFNCLSRGNVIGEIESGEKNNFKHVSDDLILWENRKPRLQTQIVTKIIRVN